MKEGSQLGGEHPIPVLERRGGQCKFYQDNGGHGRHDPHSPSKRKN